ncbi:PREDICTED: interferon-inducible double-stranded RNA-dependent protein kinase activator A homolog [Dufourea novaeangliae]|uniref:interferon-inducible double-stranded RNA-dependent protein kinase activator A homolog n=1 Tax=Dufourea novaeangliae TaxID=178035 RepID=UPI000766FA47|nr:PREDICTED: interferon-inducible double-stranded RNA-dependent protein kinase activator A homolog [Dufourea novaeangliae]
MIKTPVSILQEMMVKKQTVPDYELIHDGGGTHMNTFTYRVSCDGLSAIGIGRSKKDAKHEAAKAMLEAIAAHRGYLQLPASPSQSPQRTPLPPVIPETQRLPPDVPFVNAVGALKEVCGENNLQEPEYIQISDVGPPHAKIFTLQCKVANFKEFGIAKTKKQAKQEAAKKMLHKITDLVAESQDRQDPFNLEFEKNEEESTSNNMAKALYPSLSNLPLQTKVNLGYKLVDYHCKIKDSFNVDMLDDFIDKLQCLNTQYELVRHSNVSEEFVQQFLLSLKTLLLTMELNVAIIPLRCKDNNNYVIAARLTTSPEIVQLALGATETEAKLNALVKVIKYVLFFISKEQIVEAQSKESGDKQLVDTILHSE